MDGTFGDAALEADEIFGESGDAKLVKVGAEVGRVGVEGAGARSPSNNEKYVAASLWSKSTNTGVPPEGGVKERAEEREGQHRGDRDDEQGEPAPDGAAAVVAVDSVTPAAVEPMESPSMTAMIPSTSEESAGSVTCRRKAYV